ncbi:hypothetical protein NQ315_013601 [Exocentrus adspersus]|uniref:DUF2428 domain-containing protein n=1 Tax=Exocentrus adspersus TaxID=1586481 RepID=A0AAV8W590_9CUCU|nr:hypothetical protein NQ315_013601 [Exocentrus adspersus]
MEKKDCYGCGDNLFYKVLKERGTWLFGSPQFYQELIDCYILNQASSIVLTKLFTKHVEAPGFINTINLKSVVEENCLETGLESEKRVKNFSEIVFQNQVCKDNIKFVEEITEYLNKLTVPQQIYLEKEIFRTVLYLQVVIRTLNELHGVIDKSLEIVEAVLKNNTAGRLEYKTLKILEAFINNIVWCIIDNTNILYTAIQKDKVIKHLIFIIQRSNMKKPLTLSVLALKNLALKMNGSDSEQNYKIQFVEDTLNSLSSGAPKSDLKIRRSPESRLVIHSMCCADSHPNKPLLKWVMDCLLKVISDPKAQDSVLASALHSIEILVSDNNLQNATLSFIPDIIIQCVELFARPSWIVRNADLQLIRAIIDRFYGVCLNVSDRPKSIEDLFVLFPVLSSYFYTILSSVKLDERAVLVFQFFSESQIKERIYATESTDSFLQLFLRIIQKYSNHYAKMAVYSYSSLCSPKAIRNEICSIIRFFKANFELLSKNVFANFVLLIQLLYVKYKKSFECSIDKENIRVIDFALNDLVQVLRKYDGSFFDLILFKTKSQSIVLQEFVHNFDENSFVDRLWLHNNITFLFVNARGTSISSVLRKILFRNISSCIQIKILTILISRFENNEFASCTVEEILGVLLEKSLSVDDADNYLLNCYFKTILLFYRFTNRFNVKNIIIPKTTSNMYKIMIFVLCLSGQNQQVNPQVYNIVSTKYMDFIYFTEELRNDTISTVPYLLENAPVELRLQLLKLVFYSALFGSTYLEAYKCISLISQKTYASVLVALKDFFSVQSLHGWLKDKTLVSRFFNDVVKYIPKHVQEIQSDGYYSEESDILVPKLFLERLVTNEIKKTGIFVVSFGDKTVVILIVDGEAGVKNICPSKLVHSKSSDKKFYRLVSVPYSFLSFGSVGIKVLNVENAVLTLKQ